MENHGGFSHIEVDQGHWLSELNRQLKVESRYSRVFRSVGEEERGTPCRNRDWLDFRQRRRR